jgi:hypothetical protein
MKHQAVRTIALMLGVLLAAAPAARAGTITFGDVVRTIGASGQFRPASEVRLRFAAQSGTVQTQSSSTQSGATSSDQQPSSQTGSTTTTTPADTTLSQSGGKVETVDLGDVTGTVCDCGPTPPLTIPKGGFPWWTLAGIPIICVTGICKPGNTPECVNCGPTPTPPPSGVPEPMSLLLFGSGLLALGAGARRRRDRRQLEEEILNATTTEEV